MFAWSNLLAAAIVLGLPITGRIWIAPTLDDGFQVRRYFFALNLWGIPYLIGQYCQEDKWGDLWVQYHLQDLSYAPWGVASFLCLCFAGRSLFDKEITRRVLLADNSIVTMVTGHISEIWATIWAWYAGRSTRNVLLMGSFIAIMIAGYISEVWDTMWAWYAGGSFLQAIDVEDYVALTLGGVATVLHYLWFQRRLLRGAAS